MKDDLRARQEAGQRLEKKLLDFIVDFHACENLKLQDAKFIAGMARRIAFDEFSQPPP